MFGARMLDSRTGDSYGDIVVNSPEAITATEFHAALRRTSVPGAEPLTDQEAVGAFFATGDCRRGAAPRPGVHRRTASRSARPWRSGLRSRAARSPLGHDRRRPDVPDSTPGRPRARSVRIHAMGAVARHASRAAAQWRTGRPPIGLRRPEGDGLPRQYQSRPFMQILQFPRLFDGITLEPTPTVPEAEEIADTVSEFLSRILAGEATARDGAERSRAPHRTPARRQAKRRFR